MSKTAYKRLPVIDTESCGGCGLCQKACEAKCLDMVWDFATLKRPEDCTSCGDCVSACPSEVIHMDWVKATGSPVVGHWRDEPPPAPVVEKPKPWLWGWFEKQRA